MSAPSATSVMQKNYNLFTGDATGSSSKVRYLNRNIIPRAAKVCSRSTRILEVGPGHGELLDLLKDLPHLSLKAFEVCEPFAKVLEERGYEVTTGKKLPEYLGELGPSSVDLLVMIDVLEHIPREEAFHILEGLRKVLSPGGKILLQTPNVSGLFGYSTFAADPTHCFPLNEVSLRTLLEAAGFEDIQLSEMALPRSPANALRSFLRKGVFAVVRLITRIVGGTPVQILTHNLIAEARALRP